MGRSGDAARPPPRAQREVFRPPTRGIPLELPRVGAGKDSRLRIPARPGHSFLRRDHLTVATGPIALPKESHDHGPRPHPQRRRQRADVRHARRDQGRTPRSAIFQFRAHNRWIDGAHNRSTIKAFYGAGQEDTTRAQAFTIDAGEPAILLGSDTGPNPAEYLLHALAACLTTSLVYVAAARKVRLTEVESTLEGDMDVRGALGLSDEVRNGFTQHPRELQGQGRRAGRRSCARSSSAPRRAPPSSTWSPTASRSRWGSSRTKPCWRPGLGPRPPSATPSSHARADRHTDAGARLVRARRDARRRSWRARPRARPRGVVPARERRRAQATPATSRRRSRPSSAASASRRCTTSSSPSSRLARGDASVAIGVNMHFAVLLNMVRRWQAAVAAGDERRGARLRLLDGGDRARRRDHGHRDQRAGPGPHAARDHGDPHRRRAGGSTAARLLHDVAGRDRAPHRGHLRRRRRRRALRLRGDRRPTADGVGSTATGTRSACAPRAATR